MNSKITLRDIYDISDRLETKIDGHVRNLNQCIEGMSKRITALEYWRENLTGKITVLIGTVSLSFTIVYDYIRSKLFKER